MDQKRGQVRTPSGDHEPDITDRPLIPYVGREVVEAQRSMYD